MSEERRLRPPAPASQRIIWQNDGGEGRHRPRGNRPGDDVPFPLLFGCLGLRNSLIGGKIPLFRQVTNLGQKHLKYLAFNKTWPPHLRPKTRFSLYFESGGCGAGGPARRCRLGYATFSSSRSTVSPITRVETRAVFGSAMSPVRTPAASARRTASSTRSASSAMSNE